MSSSEATSPSRGRGRGRRPPKEAMRQTTLRLRECDDNSLIAIAQRVEQVYGLPSNLNTNDAILFAINFTAKRLDLITDSDIGKAD